MRALVACVVVTACGASAAPAPPPARAPALAPALAPAPAPALASAPALESACLPLGALGDLVAIDSGATVPPILDAGDSMANVYEHLARLVRGRATDHVRIGVYGDSNMTMDFITGEMRRVVQKRFGDGGHGFIGLATHLFYRHMDVLRGNSADWTAFAIVNNPAPDALYGFAMAAGESRQKGASTWVATAGDTSPIGRTVSALDVYYVKRPLAGAFTIDVDGRTVATTDARASEVSAGFERVDVADAPHRVVLTATTSAPVRLLGMTLERKAPSVVIDSLGVTSLDARTMATKNDPAVLAATLAHRRYDLVVFMTGTNEWFGGGPSGASVGSSHRQIMTTLFDRHRRALPGVSLLVLSPPDKVDGASATHSTPPIVTIAREKRDIAASEGVAFWDLREAMGGDASVLEFRRKGFVESDLRHFTERGGALIGDRLSFALWRDFAAWATKHPRAGCDAFAPSAVVR